MDAEIPGLASYRELHSLVAEIEALIDPYDPLDVIASFSFENLAYTTDNTLLGDGGQAFVEYVASLCLKKTGSSGKSRSIPPVVIAELQEKIERLFSSVALRRGLRNRTSSPIDKSKRHAELMFLSIRNLDDFDHLGSHASIVIWGQGRVRFFTRRAFRISRGSGGEVAQRDWGHPRREIGSS